MKPINFDYLYKVQKYCDTRAYQKEFDYIEYESNWKDTPLGRIGQQLDCISASIEEIVEIYDNALDMLGQQKIT